MRIGLYGGSFDPIHRGHIEPIKEAMRLADLDRVIYLPTARPPHKEGQTMAPAWMRYAMVELALLEDDALWTSPYEMTLDRPAYTVDTLEHHVDAMPDDELFLLIGLDSLASFDRWRNWPRIVELVSVLAMARPGFDAESVRAGLAPKLRALHERGRIRTLQNRPWDVSSTRLREQISQGETPSADLLPSLVLDYIHKYDLY